MPAERLDFAAKQGTTFRRVITYRDPDGQVVNLTGCTARLTVRDSYDDGAAVLLSLTVGDGVTMGDAAGTITLEKLVPTDIAVDSRQGVPPSRSGYYELNITWPGGIVEDFLEGRFIIKRGVPAA